MKKIWLIVLLFCLLLVGCKENEDSSLEPTQAPTQPISFDNIDDVIGFLSSKDVSKYSQEDQEIYLDSINVLTSDGHLLIPKINSATQVYRISFLPKAKYEDIGLSFWFKLNNELYQVSIYEFDDDIINNEMNIKDYKENRFNIDIKNENVIVREINGTSMNLMTSVFNLDNIKKNVVSFMPVENKYIDIKSTTSVENIISFINLLNYEKVNIN